MAVSRTCRHCQTWLLGSFVNGITGRSFLTPITRARTTQRHISMTSIARSSPAAIRGSFNLHDISEDVETDESDLTRVATRPSAPSSPAATTSPPGLENFPKASPSDLPWYLQVQPNHIPPEASESNPLSSRQRLPDLPLNPPSLLSLLLDHISTNLGLDDLSILDLRTLDPPPALGANLLMIIGTARSEKHLHVSADRLCRWLRTEFHLRPHADGLLGRNELKIQMRRKARRAKLLSSTVVGAGLTGEGEIEDGLRTGWVCVNVGRVEGGDLLEKEIEEGVEEEGGERREVIGFGAETRGYSSIVVQMLTEEKREEVDLEKLWSGILRRAQKEKEKEQEIEHVEET